MSSTQYSVRLDGNYTTLVVDKASVANMVYPNADVLKTPIERLSRRTSLNRATKDGNMDKIKYRILFRDDRSMKEVYTTIWETTENQIFLKDGLSIPIHRIYKVKMS